MSNAHRPTWTPAMGKESKGGSRQFSNKDMAAHTKLKFRQPGQTSVAEVSRTNLRTQLLLAEHEATNKKRKAQGLPPLAPLPIAQSIEAAPASSTEEDTAAVVEEESSKRRKILEEAREADRDDDVDFDDMDEDDDAPKASREDKGKGKAVDAPSDEEEEEEEEDVDDDSDDEDDTAELLRELEKIKKERAEEKERLELEKAASDQTTREEEIATGNPLLNLAAALGTSRGGSESSAGGFSVKRRWDDDLIFKNQAASENGKGIPKEFVNDLLRTEFHKKFMGKFIK